MKISEFTQAINDNQTLYVDIMRNPAELSQWIILVRDASGKSFLLANDFDAIIATQSADDLLLLLRTAGIKQATVSL
jgi:hypothetical protein